MVTDSKSKTLVQIPRTLLIGGIATGIDFLALICLVSVFHISPQMASVPCLLLGSIFQFVGNRNYVFKAHDGFLSHQILGFILAEAGALAINAYGYYLLTEYTAVSYVLSRAIANAFTFIFFSFPVWKWVFKSSLAFFICLPLYAESDLNSTLILKHRMDETIPEGQNSYYSSRLFPLLKKWPISALTVPTDWTVPVWIQPIKTEDHSNYIGSYKVMWVHAPLERVRDLIDDFEQYKDLFPDLNEVKVVAKDGNKITTFWERPSPVFFVSNTRYEQIYLIDRSMPQRTVYRYQLKHGNHVNFSDGIIVLERRGEETLISGFDFFEADWGLLKTLAESKIWNASLEGAFRGDLTLKAKAEHPDWTRKQIEVSVDEMIRKFPIDVKKMKYLDFKSLP